jgi:ubiquinone/menaquinone biosynthesis C-methylase UbiE
MHDDLIISEFSYQSEPFNRAKAMSSAETLGALLHLLPSEPAEKADRWLDSACGTGLVARALAPRVDTAVGIDLTPAMLEVARRESSAAHLHNVSFELGDAAALPVPGASFDGAVTRFSLHHIPVPSRVVTELVRVVRPGGWIILADHVTDEDSGAAAWHQEIERLRDPSHWSCLAPSRIRSIAEAAGLVLDQEQIHPFTIDFEEWLARGTAGTRNASLIAAALQERSSGTPCFGVTGDAGVRRLRLQYSLTRWYRP